MPGQLGDSFTGGQAGALHVRPVQHRVAQRLPSRRVRPRPATRDAACCKVLPGPLRCSARRHRAVLGAPCRPASRLRPGSCPPARSPPRTCAPPPCGPAHVAPSAGTRAPARHRGSASLAHPSGLPASGRTKAESPHPASPQLTSEAAALRGGMTEHWNASRLTAPGRRAPARCFGEHPHAPGRSVARRDPLQVLRFTMVRPSAATFSPSN